MSGVLIILWYFEDENDIDYMIGDLTKEEAQLIITRILRKVGEDDIRNQIEIVRHARNQVTAGMCKVCCFFVQVIDIFIFIDQIEKQMAQIKQLTEMRNALPSPMSPMYVPFGSPMGMGADGEGMGSPYQAPGGSGISAGRLRAVKNRVRDSFKKRRNVPGKTHIVKMDNLEEDFLKIKDFAAKGSIKNALSMLEAITEEFADRVAEVCFTKQKQKNLLFIFWC